MTPSYITHKPWLQLGSFIGHKHAVSKPLHCDDSVQLYQLGANASSSIIAVLRRLAEGENESFACTSLEEFWLSLPNDAIKILDIRIEVIAERKVVKALVEIEGRWGGECAGLAADITDEALRHLLQKSMELCLEQKTHESTPDYRNSLLFVKNDFDDLTIVPLTLQTATANKDVSILCDVVRLCYLLVASIETETLTGSTRKIPLSRWAKNISPTTANLLLPYVSNSNEALKGFVHFLELLRGEVKTDPAENTSKEIDATGLCNVAGMHKLKALLVHDVIEPLRNPEKYSAYGLTIPNGILLFGPPGCGKTYIAQQLAKELDYYFIEVTPAEVAGIYVHQTVMKIREIFDRAEAMAPAMVFLDEFEAFAPARAGLGNQQQYKSEEVNELLTQLSNCADRRILLIAATNEPLKIDSAVRRTGRLDKLIYVGPPDEDARLEMLAMHLAGRPVDENLDLRSLACLLEGYSASDLKFLVDESARLALRADCSKISMAFLLNAVERILPSVTKTDEEGFAAFMERGT